MEPQTFIFIGPSGSGKGTQVEKLKGTLQEQSDRPQFHFYTGDHFRSYMKDYSDTLAAQLSTEINDHGGLQPPFLATWLWADAFVKHVTGEEHLIIDGSPRTVTEMNALDSAMRFFKRFSPHVILIDISREEASNRLLARGRKDDTEEGIANRLDWYETNVVPAIELYEKDDYYKFHRIDGEQSIEGVTEAILEVVGLTHS